MHVNTIGRQSHNMSDCLFVKTSTIEFDKISFMPAPTVERNQLNLRMSDELRKAIDAKRIELAGTSGSIPTRSEILRLALEGYLGIDLSKTEADRRTLKKSDR